LRQFISFLGFGTLIVGITLVLGISAGVQAHQAQGAGGAAQRTFETRCGRCHGADGNGGEMGPAIPARLARLDDRQLAKLLREGLPTKGMPPNPLPPAQATRFITFLRELQKRGLERPVVRMSVQTTDGHTLDGLVLGEGFGDLQLRTDDKRVHLLRRTGSSSGQAAGQSSQPFRAVSSETDWPTYNGDPGGNRYSTLTQINTNTVSRLAPRWIFPLPEAGVLQVTPVVVDGIMYVTESNECFALDAGSGRPIWHFKQPRTKNITGGGANRGVAIAGDRVFMLTDHAHLLALHRFTGERLFDVPLADYRLNYSASSAPLIAGNLVISGIAGGEHGANGFVIAHDQETGKEVWRFNTVPRKGEPLSETWQGIDIEHGGAPTWFTGSYDPALDLVYWPTGNPSKEYNGDDRKGDNLYSDCILALDRKTGKLRWHYQFTPHDLWDWDATETSVLIDADWESKPRKLMLHANRNGFFYVFDRTDGTLLLAKPFVRNLNWASGIGADGRPIKLSGLEPTPRGTLVCPSQDGATNWFSPSFNPTTGLYYVQTFEKCSIYTKRAREVWQSGKTYLGGTQHTADDPKPVRSLKAIDIRNGSIAWEIPQPGRAQSWGGTLTTAGGLVIFAEEGGALMAADASTGKPLWSFQTHQTWKASPMTYTFDGQQFIAIASGSTIIALALQN
jgi:alcohol dehydrogenase (cytochrome c)